MAVSLINRGLLTPSPHLEMVLGAALPGGEDESEDQDEVGEYAGEFEFDKDGSATEEEAFCCLFQWVAEEWRRSVVWRAILMSQVILRKLRSWPTGMHFTQLSTYTRMAIRKRTPTTFSGAIGAGLELTMQMH
jgi:hypothetical protein